MGQRHLIHALTGLHSVLYCYLSLYLYIIPTIIFKFEVVDFF